MPQLSLSPLVKCFNPLKLYPLSENISRKWFASYFYLFIHEHLININRQPSFNLPRQQWSLLNHFRTEQGHCGACRRKWWLTDTDLCPCGETQTMSHIVESCPLTKLNGGLSRLHSADEDVVSWLTSYGSWNTYEKKKKNSFFLSTVYVKYCWCFALTFWFLSGRPHY